MCVNIFAYTHVDFHIDQVTCQWQHLFKAYTFPSAWRHDSSNGEPKKSRIGFVSVWMARFVLCVWSRGYSHIILFLNSFMAITTLTNPAMTSNLTTQVVLAFSWGGGLVSWLSSRWLMLKPFRFSKIKIRGVFLKNKPGSNAWELWHLKQTHGVFRVDKSWHCQGTLVIGWAPMVWAYSAACTHGEGYGLCPLARSHDRIS